MRIITEKFLRLGFSTKKTLRLVVYWLEHTVGSHVLRLISVQIQSKTLNLASLNIFRQYPQDDHRHMINFTFH